MGVVLKDHVQYQLVDQHATVIKCVTALETVVPILKKQDAFLPQQYLHLVCVWYSCMSPRVHITRELVCMQHAPTRNALSSDSVSYDI